MNVYKGMISYTYCTKAYPLDRPVSGSIWRLINSISPNGANTNRKSSSVILKWRDPTYKRVGPNVVVVVVVLNYIKENSAY